MKRRELLSAAAAAAAASVIPLPADAATDATARLTPPKGQILAAFVVGPRSVVIDFAGPWEAFNDVMSSSKNGDMTSAFNTVMVSDHAEPLDFAGMIVTPKYTYANFPAQPNVIVMGAQGEYSPEKIAWIKHAAKGADVVMSVCTGAFLLAQTGLLDGLRATTHHDAYDDFEKQFPKVHLVRGPRFVDNGKIATSGGESSGIDLAFHIVSRYYGESAANDAADIMEFTRSTPRPA
jgi:transcriptional regulator GlxA family with amidase domain